MDLSELRPGVASRHPWELARLRAVTTILRRRVARVDSILDVGCGDGFIGETLQASLGARTLTGIDVHLPADRCGVFHANGGRIIERYQTIAELAGTRRFDLALALDVIEHVEDDVSLLEQVIRPRLAERGLVLVTVPAFQLLFTAHDRELRHYRRYSARQLRHVVSAAGLVIQDAGYLFASLLAPRLVEKLLDGLGWRRSRHGVGGWTGSAASTALIASLLTADANVLMLAARAGVPLPGLTAWALCRSR